MSDNLSTAEGTSADGIFDDLADIFSHEVSKSIPPEKCFSFPLSFSFFFCWQTFGSDLTLLSDIKMQQTSLFFFLFTDVRGLVKCFFFLLVCLWNMHYCSMVMADPC